VSQEEEPAAADDQEDAATEEAAAPEEEPAADENPVEEDAPEAMEAEASHAEETAEPMEAEAAPAEDAPASDFEEIGEKEVEAANEAAAEAKQEDAIEKEDEKGEEEEASQELAPEEHTPKRPDPADEEPAEAEETMEADVTAEADVTVEPEDDLLTLGVENDDLSEEQAEEKAAVNLNSAKAAKVPEAYTEDVKPAETATSAQESPKKSPKKMTKAEKKKMWQEKRKETAAKKREERMKKAAEAKSGAATATPTPPVERKNGIWICGLQKSVKAMTIKEFLIKNEIKGTVLALKVALRRATQESFAYIELKDKPDHELALKVFSETTELGKITVERVDSDPTIKKASPAKPPQKRSSEAANNKATNGLMPKRQKIGGESEEAAAKPASFKEPAKPMPQAQETDAQLEAKVTNVKVTFLSCDLNSFSGRDRAEKEGRSRCQDSSGQSRERAQQCSQPAKESNSRT
jgi:hypothetical protein